MKGVFFIFPLFVRITYFAVNVIPCIRRVPWFFTYYSPKRCTRSINIMRPPLRLFRALSLLTLAPSCTRFQFVAASDAHHFTLFLSWRFASYIVLFFRPHYTSYFPRRESFLASLQCISDPSAPFRHKFCYRIAPYRESAAPGKNKPENSNQR